MALPDSGRPLAELITQLEMRGHLVARPARMAGAEVSVRGVGLDSRAIRAGDVFAAVPGGRDDGHRYVTQAVARGAIAVIVERPQPDVGVPQLLVAHSRRALALAAAWLHGFPSRSLGVIGVTGTDGKTTTGFLIRAMLESAGLPTGMISTIETTAGGAVVDRGRATTPEAPELQAHLAAMVAAGDRFAVLESTSHGLALDKAAEVAYDVAVLTNVTHEHLEFHGTLEAYRAAKRRLFESLAETAANPNKGWGKWAIVNLDDDMADDYAAAAREAGARSLRYGTTDNAEIRGLLLDEHEDGIEVGVRAPRWAGAVRLRLTGRFNVHNTLAAVAVGEALGLDPDAMRRGLESLVRVPGRLERIESGQPFGVVVDYAHTPNALATLLDDLAPGRRGRPGGLICVFGSAGERDTLKRPMMGRVAAERCRLVVLTDEDPRGEDRQRILDEIVAGVEATGGRPGRDVLLVPDREAAIRTALERAGPADVVVICGKGHEQTMETASGPVPWNDAGVARRALAALGYGEAAGEGRGGAEG